ncbi:MAG: ribulose-phosphate 3-epimerase [Acetatifactor sp.]|nr:ribulose-phosphate 3-epimerase [Acetatifactor sp.]
MMNILSPSILSADFWNLGEAISRLEEAQVPWLHIDVMDGIFVPSISYGMPVMQCIRKHTKMFLDVHLMIDRPERYVQAFADNGADLINFHIESTQKITETIQAIHEVGRKAGISIKPGTPAAAVEPYLEMVDMVLVMTVEPGFAGQVLIPECLTKAKEVRAMADARGLSLDIEVDGGIYLGNVEETLASGANVIVAGSSIFKEDIAVNTKAFMEKLK